MSGGEGESAADGWQRARRFEPRRHAQEGIPDTHARRQPTPWLRGAALTAALAAATLSRDQERRACVLRGAARRATAVDLSDLAIEVR